MSSVRFDEVAEFINGKAFKPSDWSESGLPIIRIQNLTGTSERFNYFNGDVEDKFRVRNGDILISWSASLGVYYWQGAEAVLNQHIFKVCPKKNIDPDYFYYASTGKLQEMVAQVHGATMQHITKDRFDALLIALPSLTEQRRIAKYLKQADRLRRIRRFALEMSDSFLPAVFVEMFGDPVRNAQAWPTESLGVLGKVTTGGTPPSAKSGMFGGKTPFITPGDLEVDTKYSQRFLTDDGVNESVIVRSGSTLVCCIGATIGKTDKARVKCSFNQQINAIEWGKNINDDFGFYLMRFFSKIVAERGQSTTLPILKKSAFEELILPVPPLPIQEKFADIVERHEQLRSTQVESLRQAEHLFQSLLHQAFSGK